jgi:hypothetical protein
VIRNTEKMCNGVATSKSGRGVLLRIISVVAKREGVLVSGVLCAQTGH